MRDGARAARRAASSRRWGWPFSDERRDHAAPAARSTATSPRRCDALAERTRRAELPGRGAGARRPTCATAASRSSSRCPPTTSTRCPGASTPPTSGATATGRTTSPSRSCSCAWPRRAPAPRPALAEGRAAGDGVTGRRPHRRRGRRVDAPVLDRAPAGCRLGGARPGDRRARRRDVPRARRAGRAASTPRARWCWRGRARDARRGHALGARQRPRRASPRRWASCSCAAPTRPTSRSAATSRRALFDADGRLVAQAAHIPVHLGAMPDAVAAVLARDPRPGRRLRAQRPLRRRHAPARRHARLAGRRRRARRSPTPSRARTTPTSAACAPARSRRPRPRSCRRASSSRRCAWCGRASWCATCSTWSWPTCARPAMRRGDLRAQLAAAAVAQERLEGAGGAARLRRRARRPWTSLVAYAERRARAAVAELPTASTAPRTCWRATASTSDDIPIRVAVDDRAATRVRVDFAGTAPATRGNVNCAIGVTRSACCFALRVVLPADIPTNAGLYAPLDGARRPPGCLVNAQSPGRRRGRQHGDLAAHRRHRAGRPAQARSSCRPRARAR